MQFCSIKYIQNVVSLSTHHICNSFHLVAIKHYSPSSPILTPGDYHSTFWFWIKHLMLVESQSAYLLMTDISVSVSIITSTFIHVAAYHIIFLRLHVIPLYVYFIFCLSIYLKINAFGLTPCLTIVINAAMNTGIQIPLPRFCSQFFWYISGSVTTRSQTTSIFNFFKNCHSVSRNVCIILNSQQCTRVLISPHPCQHLVFYFLTVAILKV